jgi:CHASE2 domain-containing sensor protein
MNIFFKKDSFFATLFVFIIIGLLYFNTVNTHIINPLKVALTDFSFNDLAFSEAHLNNNKDERIVIIDIDTIGRSSIAKLINHLAVYEPKVIGLDILFSKKEGIASVELASVIKSTKQVVLSERLEYTEESKDLSVIKSQFSDSEHHSGYVNFRVEESGVIRYYPPFIYHGKDIYESFTTALIKTVDTTAYKKIISRNKTNEWINYKRVDSNYYVFSYQDILNDRIDSSFIKDKIVLLGLVSSNPNNIEDKHFTPLNSKLFGRSKPDMNGVIIHANIISMILDNDYIVRVPGWVMLILGLFITWIYMSFLIRFYIHKHLWFHVAAKFMELLLGILLVYLAIIILRFFSVSIDFTSVLVAIIISVDVLYFYEGLRNWLEKKFSIDSIFNKKQH